MTEEDKALNDSESRPGQNGKVRWTTFLKDVLVCSLGAYGGPEAHMSVFMDQLVARKKYLTEKDLIELIALCSILPGPTSTQTIVAVGYRTGGPLLTLLTMLVWAMPVLAAMTALSFLYQVLAAREDSRPAPCCCCDRGRHTYLNLLHVSVYI